MFVTRTSTFAGALLLILVGDSTVAPDGGWGPAFEKLLNPATIQVVDMASPGRSSKSYRDEGKWQPVLALKPDYIFLQFGHNDMKGKGPARETDPATTYPANMARYVDEARAAGAKPVLITSLARRMFDASGKINDRFEPYVDAVRKVAAEKDVPLADLHARSIELFEKLSPQGTADLNRPNPKSPAQVDWTHLSAKGGEVTAPLVAGELKKVDPEFARYFINP